MLLSAPGACKTLNWVLGTSVVTYQVYLQARNSGAGELCVTIWCAQSVVNAVWKQSCLHVQLNEQVHLVMSAYDLFDFT